MTAGDARRVRLAATRGTDIPSQALRVCVDDDLDACPKRRGERIVGSAERDRIEGTKGSDAIRGRGGDDRIDIRKGGSDRVDCGPGRRQGAGQAQRRRRTGSPATASGQRGG